MTGETNLQMLLKNMQPVLQGVEFVFCTMEPATASGLHVSPIGQFFELEGVTLILAKAEAEANGIDFSYVCRMITLKVHSSLEAVGFLAAVTARLAQSRISVNVVSAYYHDHLFVPTGSADEAMKVLEDLARRTS
ncbi:ACT domain-containing protein [Aporhodopirellula aestuarii]|uniref:ACT domain-containing protein n=1 Tax=Aporhodopirellula aestuarii TaxID=2950107 RepID=A0ABT0TY37_9BACT|nr:ACT domain-containing protein [Aporhodopirellula aestuarii]MCM2369495.1 ACT domain-containing protein [Aporhodopirellula aestuarii]